MPEGGAALDLGCGAGEPIARYLIDAGYSVTGMDYAAPMIEIARARLPAARWIAGDMRDLALGEAFDGVIGWDSFFHLTMAEQRALLPKLAAHIAPGGALMLTVGPEAGETAGMVEGEAVYHASLDPDEYRTILTREGFADIVFVAEDPDCDFHSILLASKRS
ncbi:MAG: class I SAM-dependent methyltransferase [Parvularculaceae bacterium]